MNNRNSSAPISYASVAGQNRSQAPNVYSAYKGRERLGSFKRSAPVSESEPQPVKRRNTEKTVVTGSSLGKTRKMRSPGGIFCLLFAQNNH